MDLIPSSTSFLAAAGLGNGNDWDDDDDDISNDDDGNATNPIPVTLVNSDMATLLSSFLILNVNNY